jgi:hypothetical protein
MASSTSSGSKWSPPKAYIPRHIIGKIHENEDERRDTLSSKEFGSSKSQMSAQSMSPGHQRQPADGGSSLTNTPRCQVVGLFSASNFRFDIADEEASMESFEDDLSQISSSTLSTHTTLKDLCHFTTSPSPERTYGIRMPFPTLTKPTSAGPDGTPRHIVTGYRETLPTEAKMSHSRKTNGIPFQAIQSTPRPAKSSVPTSDQRPRSRRSGSYDDKPAAEPLYRKDVVERSAVFVTESSLHDGSDIHPCPQLTMTGSSEESSWLDFSSSCSDNPFQDPFQVGQSRVDSFSPIEKAPHQTYKGPVMTVKPSLQTPTGTVTCLFPSQHSSTRAPQLRNQPYRKPQLPVSKKDLNHLLSGQARDSAFRPVGAAMKGVAKKGATKTTASFVGTPGIAPSTKCQPTGSGGHKARPTKNAVSDVSKYSVMLKSGFSLQCVRKAMERDDVDPSIIDLVEVVSNGACP